MILYIEKLLQKSAAVLITAVALLLASINSANAAGVTMRTFGVLGNDCSGATPYTFSTTTSLWASTFCESWQAQFKKTSSLKSSWAQSLTYGCLPAKKYTYVNLTNGLNYSYISRDLVSCANYPFMAAGAPSEFHGMEDSWAFFAFYYNSTTCSFNESAALEDPRNYTYSDGQYRPYGMVNAFTANGFCSPSYTFRSVDGVSELVPEYKKLSCSRPFANGTDSTVTLTLCADAGCQVNCTSKTLSGDTLSNCASLKDTLGPSSLSIFALNGTISDTNYTNIYFSAACLRAGDNPTFSNFQAYVPVATPNSAFARSGRARGYIIVLALFSAAALTLNL